VKELVKIENSGMALSDCQSSSEVPNWSKAISWLNLFLSVSIVFLHTNLESSHLAYINVKAMFDVCADSATPAFLQFQLIVLFATIGNMHTFLI